MSSGPKYVARVRMAPDGYRHEHIDEVEYHLTYDGELHAATVSVMAMLIEDHGWDVRVVGAPDNVRVQIVRPYGRPPYLRAFVGDAPTNALLDLPRY